MNGKRLDTIPPLPEDATVPAPATDPSPFSARQLVRRGAARLLPRGMLLVHGPRDRPEVCLTFDDGPHPRHTPAVLEALRAAAVQATFFVVGARAATWPRLVRQVAFEGHVVGHHSFTHGRPDRTPADALAVEARRTSLLLQNLVGSPPRLFRPPHGKLTARKALSLWGAGQTIVLWSRDPKDFACGSAADVRAYFQVCPLRGGDIVLLHDVNPRAAEVLPWIVDHGRRRGLRFVTPLAWL